jgi:ribose transport system permease protein
VIATVRNLLSIRGISPIWPATAILFVVSPLLAPGSLGASALLSMLPFAAILAVAGIGQTLVVQQRGLDLSVPGMISLTTLIVTRVPNGADGRLPEALLLALVACLVAGLISGIAITRFGITPLVATLGVNALAIGAILQVTNGTSTAVAPPGLDAFAIGKTAGIPNTVIVAAVVIAIVTLVIRRTPPGRRFVAVGSSPTAAYVAGLRVRRYVIATYALAALAAGLAGVLLAGFLQTPGLLPGDSYLLPSIAAVVLGGTSLAGGAGSVLATAGGALFLTQLQQVVLGTGASPAAELVIQGLIIAVGMALRTVHWRRLALRAEGGGG